MNELAALRWGDHVPLRGDVVVVSPHCDDAVLSLGSVLASRRRASGSSTVLTLLAGDPGSSAPAGPWDRTCGFAGAGAATRARRREDVEACRRVGARAVHLDGTDEQYADLLDDQALWAQAAPHLEGADEVLLPGFPLRHVDHRRTTALLLRHLPDDRPVRLYAEDPYATWTRSLDVPVADPCRGATAWSAPPVRRSDVLSGLRATAAYRSQLGALADYLRQQPSTLRRRVLGPRPIGLLAELAASTRLRGQPITAPVAAGVLRAALSAG